jgi:hypothetical protein
MLKGCFPIQRIRAPDPKLPVGFPRSGQMRSYGIPVIRFYEAAVRGFVQSANC